MHPHQLHTNDIRIPSIHRMMDLGSQKMHRCTTRCSTYLCKRKSLRKTQEERGGEGIDKVVVCERLWCVAKLITFFSFTRSAAVGVRARLVISRQLGHIK